MTITQLSPYVVLAGKSEAAIQLYERALGAKTETMIRFRDVKDMKVPPDRENHVLHCEIRIGAGVLMLSDATRDGKKVSGESNMHVTLNFDDPSELATRFEALASGGKVDMPIHDTFYGGKLGMLTDAVGIQWMFNFSPKKA